MERRTFALKIAYDGAAFRGWQKQPGLPTVQEALERALGVVVGERVRVQGAARTDAGVHAEGQEVASFSWRRDLDAGALARDLAVPSALRILAAAAAPRGFHARASASAKRYCYRFSWGGQRQGPFHLGDRRPDWERAREALAGLRGLAHLSGLASPAATRRPAPPLEESTLEAGARETVLTIRAAAFRKHEIRNLAGHLAAVALGLAAPESLAELAQRTRPWRGATAPAHGLTLLEVIYPPDLDPF